MLKSKRSKNALKALAATAILGGGVYYLSYRKSAHDLSVGRMADVIISTTRKKMSRRDYVDAHKFLPSKLVNARTGTGIPARFHHEAMATSPGGFLKYGTRVRIKT